MLLAKEFQFQLCSYYFVFIFSLQTPSLGQSVIHLPECKPLVQAVHHQQNT